MYHVGVVVCTCNTATFEAEFQNGMLSVQAGGNTPPTGGQIM